MKGGGLQNPGPQYSCTVAIEQNHAQTGRPRRYCGRLGRAGLSQTKPKGKYVFRDIQIKNLGLDN